MAVISLFCPLYKSDEALTVVTTLTMDIVTKVGSNGLNLICVRGERINMTASESNSEVVVEKAEDVVTRGSNPGRTNALSSQRRSEEEAKGKEYSLSFDRRFLRWTYIREGQQMRKLQKPTAYFFSVTVVAWLWASLGGSFAEELQSVRTTQSSNNEIPSALPRYATSDQDSNQSLLRKLRDELQKLEDENENLKNENEFLKSEFGREASRTQLDYHKKYYSYLSKKADINLAQFEWQQRASEFLLWLVVSVVLSGILFSGYQLWKAAQIKKFSGDSSIEISIQKVKLTSSIVGLLVLTISIIFLYLFLVEVYRIKIVDLSPTETKPTDIRSPASSGSGAGAELR